MKLEKSYSDNYTNHMVEGPPSLSHRARALWLCAAQVACSRATAAAKNYCYYLYVGKWVTKYTLMTFCVTLA
jgi:hypothetical protein